MLRAAQRQRDGVILSLTDGWLRLQVCDEDTLRVVFSPTRAGLWRRSLAVVADWRPVRWSLRQTPDAIDVATARLQARVERGTGAVSFCDARGRVLLAEPREQARVLEPARVAGEDAYHATQRFVLAPGEALYGLGQHANGAMNQRGQVVTLRQVNMDVGVPVLVSSRGYGVLWDNPSLTVVNCGAPDAMPIPAERLFDVEGRPGALTGMYFDGTAFETLKVTRRDAGIDFDWPGSPAEDVDADRFSVRWVGEVETGPPGEYVFVIQADDGVRLWVDDKLIIDDWTVHPPKTLYGRIRLEGGRRYPIKLEFYENTGGAVARLRWAPPRLGAEETCSWWSEVADAIDYYFFYGPQLDAVIAAYRRATGAVPMFPRWAWGFWQCRERYQTQAELLSVLEEYRRRGTPLDGIIQDWFYWAPAPWGSHQFDPARYPDPAAMVRQVHERHAHLMISVWAKFDPGSEHYRELDERGLLYTPGTTSYYDAFSPEGRAVYWRQVRDSLFSLGVDAWWLDASEPEDGAFFSYDADRGVMTAEGPSARVLNAYPLMHTAGVYAGQRAATADKRVFILTRSAWAGQQRNAAVTWSGDIAGEWDVFRRQIPAGLNFCLSGIPYWNTDIGGFFSRSPTDPDYLELFVRWFQFGAFCPMFRVHGTGARKEMWEFGPEAERILVEYDRLRYRLLPYIYSVAWRVTSQGYTMMRGLAMDFRDDPQALDVGDQFMFGPALLVCPVVERGATKRGVYLPKGARWYDFWTGRAYDGGAAIEAEAPLERLPLFVRAGAILPMGPVIQWDGEKPCDPVEVRVYPGADGSFTLYEDAGDGYDYERGAYSTISMSWQEKAQRLMIGERRGTFPGILPKRTFRVVVVSPGRGTGIEPVGRADAEVRYEGKGLSLRLSGKVRRNRHRHEAAGRPVWLHRVRDLVATDS